MEDSNSLAALPLSEIQQVGLSFAGIWVLARNPGQDLLGQDLTSSTPKGPLALCLSKRLALLWSKCGSSSVALLDTALPINVSKQKLICYDKSG